MKIPLGEIASESNRKYTKDEGFEQLVNSVRKHGIIEPPVVRALPEGGYGITAGRRRVDALRRVIQEDGGDPGRPVECVVLEGGDPSEDEEIALAENVNRQGMHPLDEAAAMARMAARGVNAAEIAKYYARSPSAVYQRLRLAGLSEDLKGMFRDGLLDIGGAAVLAELPEEDQREFHKLHGSGEVEVERYEITNFVFKRQRFTVSAAMRKGCKACEKKTHNEDNELFEEYKSMSDVCLDADCYRKKWKELIEKALKEKITDQTTGNECRIWFSGGVPQQLYGKASYVEFSVLGDKEPVLFDVLKEKDWEFGGETKKKNGLGACFRIHTDYNGKMEVTRVVCKAKPPKGEAKAAAAGPKAGLYGREIMAAAAEGCGCASGEELAGKLEDRLTASQFENEIQENVFTRVVASRIEAERSGKEKPRDYFSMFVQSVDFSRLPYCVPGDPADSIFGDREKEWMRGLTGKKSVKEISGIMSDATQMLFHFLLLCDGMDYQIPDLGDLKNGKDLKTSSFWEYAGMTAEAYKTLYLDAAREVAGEALKPEAEKGKKKKAGGGA